VGEVRDFHVAHLRDNSCVTLADPSDFPQMRISDADRDRAASILSDALAEGRLTPEEHSQRLDAIYAARTAADIEPVVRDIPGAAAALARQAPAQSPVPADRPVRLVAFFSGTSRKGIWRVPPDMAAVSVFGGTDLDLREAVLPARQVRIRATCFFGGIDITVPPEMHVVDSGWAIMGGREVPPDTEESASPDAPVLHVTGLTVFGGLSVRRKRRKNRDGAQPS
jgi:hypothetical protein